MKLLVRKSHPYGCNQYYPGDVYECPAKWGRLMIAVRKAEEFFEVQTPVVASEAVRAQAAASNVDITQVTGSGKDGRSLRRDIQNYLDVSMRHK